MAFLSSFSAWLYFFPENPFFLAENGIWIGLQLTYIHPFSFEIYQIFPSADHLTSLPRACSATWNAVYPPCMRVHSIVIFNNFNKFCHRNYVDCIIIHQSRDSTFLLALDDFERKSD
jgi:hypothetical protein